MTIEQTPQVSLAARLMDELFTSNTYQELKETEFKLDQIREEIKTRHPEGMKRWDFGRVIAIQQYPHSYEEDSKGLNELLYDLGILIEATYFDITKDTPEFIKRKLEPFQNPIETYVKFFPKKGLVSKIKESYARYNDEALIDLWLRTKRNEENLALEIEKCKKEMLKCSELQETRKVITDFGSVQVVNKKPTYDMERALAVLGPEFIIQNATSSMTKLDEFVVKGVITEKEINQFRTLVKISERYVVLTKEAAQAQYDVLNYRKHQQAANLAELWAHKI